MGIIMTNVYTQKAQLGAVRTTLPHGLHVAMYHLNSSNYDPPRNFPGSKLSC